MNSRTKMSLGIIATLLVIVIGVMTWHQRTHFNKNTTINGVAVGGLTAQQAYDKVAKTKLTNEVKLDGKVIYQGQASSAGFTKNDLSKFQTALKKQVTFFPSSKAKNIKVVPSHVDKTRIAAMRAALKANIEKENAGRKAPVDAKAVLANGKVTIKPAQKGNRYDTEALLKDFDQNAANVKIVLHKQYQHPLAASSKTVKQEAVKLKALLNQKLTYQVENKTYTLTTNDIITKATYLNHQYQFDTTALDKLVKKVNKNQSTLDKSFTFTTHSGKQIKTATGGSYGWRLSKTKAAATLTKALISHQTSVNAKNDVYGVGYNTGGIGYGTTSNHGIGNTYAEVSISDQHVWFYKDGKCVFDASVVTGKHSSGDDTPKGVWYIMYKQRNTTLRGTSDNGSAYASPVSYWAPFTDSGCGFHDASWRTNWSSTAYLNDGSNGCVNMHTSDAGTAYDSLTQYEPVIVY